MANNQFTNEDRKLFHKIEADIKKNCAKYSEAGKWLDQFYDVAKFWQEKVEHLQTLNEICKSHKECECEFCEEAEWLSWVIEKRNFTSQDEYIEISDMEQEFREGLFKEEVPAIYRLLEAKSELTSQYISNCGMLSEQDAKCIYLTNWLLTSPQSRNDTDIEITKFQRYELKDLEGIIYSRMGLLFSTQRNIEEWIQMIKTAQHRLDVEKENKPKPASPKKSAEKADKQDKVTHISQPDSILGDTWSILGIPINVKKLCTKLKSRPFLLSCCLSLIVIIATYPLWHPVINKTDRDSSANYKPKESKVSGISETQTKRISVPNTSLQKSVGTCEVIDIVKLFVEDVQGWARWDTGAQPGTPIAWITEGKYDDPPKDMGSTFGVFARNGAVILTIKDKPIYRQLKQTVVPGTWDIWLVGPNGGVLVVKMESEYGKDLPFDISKVLKKSGFKVTLYKGLEVRNTTGNFIIYHIESPGGGKAWLAESWSIGTAGGTQEIWITYKQKYADILWEKEGSLGKQHLLWKQESNEVSRN